MAKLMVRRTLPTLAANSLRPNGVFGTAILARALADGYQPNDLTTSVRTDVVGTTRGGTINIDAGSYDTPYTVSTADRTYRLLGNVTFEGCGIRIAASNVTIDLNGYTLTYHNVAPSDVETATVDSSGGGGEVAYLTLNPTGLTLTANSHAYCVVEFTSGAENGNVYEVLSNTTTTLTMENHNNVSDDVELLTWQNGGPTASDTFRIYDPRKTFGVGVVPGVYPGAVEVVNGYIVEGAGYGRGVNYDYSTGCSGIQYLDGGQPWVVGGVSVTWNAANAGGVNLRGSAGAVVKYCEFTDDGTLVTNRQRGPTAVQTYTSGTIQYCRLHRFRQSGLNGRDGTVIEYNELYGDSRATNSTGIGTFSNDNVTVRYNNVYAVGQHPVCMGFAQDSDGVNVHHNWCESRSNRESPEYGYNLGCALAVRWGTRAAQNHYHNNALITYAGDTVYKSRTILLTELDDVTDELIEDNFIGAYSSDNTECHCISGGSDKVLVRNNTFVSSHNIFWMADNFTNPTGIRFVDNTTLKVGSDPSFATFFLGILWPEAGDFISGIYGTGTAVDDYSGSSDAETILRYGWTLTVTVTSGGSPVEGATVTVKDKDTNVLREGYTTDANGEVVVDVPTYYRQGPTFSTTNTLMPLTVEAVSGALTGSNTISPTSDDTITVTIE